MITAAMQSGERGGAEAFYAGLVGALRQQGTTRRNCRSIDESNFDFVLALIRQVLRPGCRRQLM